MPFELAERYSYSHLIVQPSDAKLNPPESYLFIQDGLIICMSFPRKMVLRSSG